jgi:hypothetical protein
LRFGPDKLGAIRDLDVLGCNLSGQLHVDRVAIGIFEQQLEHACLTVKGRWDGDHRDDAERERAGCIRRATHDCDRPADDVQLPGLVNRSEVRHENLNQRCRRDLAHGTKLQEGSEVAFTMDPTSAISWYQCGCGRRLRRLTLRR